MKRLTVAVPTFNRVDFLRKCLNELFKLGDKIEIIVSDNNSQDETRDYLSSLDNVKNLMVHTNPENKGMVGNWNTLLYLIETEYFLLLSDDDLIDAGEVEKFVELINRDDFGDYDVCFYRTKIIDTNGKLLKETKPLVYEGTKKEFIRSFLRLRTQITLSSTIFKLSALKNVGGYDKEDGLLADTAAWMRVVSNKNYYISNQFLSSYRIHQGALTNVTKIDDWMADHNHLFNGLNFENGAPSLKDFKVYYMNQYVDQILRVNCYSYQRVYQYFAFALNRDNKYAGFELRSFLKLLFRSIFR